VRTLRAFFLRIRGLFSANRSDADFAAEIESHVALHTEDGIRAGLAPQEARRRALIRLGGAEQTRQAYRERGTFPWLESILQDIRYGLRTLRRSPGFTITAVLTLALGIGACTAIFSLVNAVLIRSLPYGDPSRLVYLYTPSPQIPIPPEVIGPSYADFFDLKQQSHSFASMTAFEQADFTLAAQGAVQRIGAARVDETFFATLQSTPALGRVIDANDNQPGHDKVAVIGHSLWQSAFAGSADVLSRSLVLDGASYRIVGVMQPEFQYPANSDLPYGNSRIPSTQIWIPLALTPEHKANRSPDSNVTVARLNSGVSIRQAQSEMSAIMTRLDKLHIGDRNVWGALVEGFMDNALGPVRPLMRLLLGAVSLVLLIACGNAANLLLARASGRARELGVLAALGAGRRIVRQLLTESLLLGSAAGAIGVALAWLFLRTLPFLDPGNIPRLREASLDPRVLAFTVAVSLLTSILTGVLPALAVSRANLTDFLKTGNSRQTPGGHSRTQAALIVAQTALVVVLLAGAGLVLRSYINVLSVDTGFSPSTVTLNISLDERYTQPQQRLAFFNNLIDKLGALPGVQAVGAINSLPLSNSESLSNLWVDGFRNNPQQLVQSRRVTPGYFSAMNIPLEAGRLFASGDSSSAANTVIVNRSFANAYFADRNPVGGRISQDERHAQWMSVVGVVADVRHTSLEEAPAPQMYLPGFQDMFGSGYIAVRSIRPSSTVATEVRSTLHAIDPNLAITGIRTMGDLVSEASARRRFQTSLLAVFAAIALFLALVGLYSLMAYSVGRRTREVGIRMALGAQRTDVLFLVLKKAAFLLVLGLIAGLSGTWFATRAIRSFLYGVNQHDPVTIVSVCALLAVCGLVAALIPARRAASIDPMQALRTE
jgi:putative ABC transport system permease protein